MRKTMRQQKKKLSNFSLFLISTLLLIQIMTQNVKIIVYFHFSRPKNSLSNSAPIMFHSLSSISSFADSLPSLFSARSRSKSDGKPSPVESN